MKKIVLVIIFLISITSFAESQTRLKFGNVFLKDTLTGSLKVTSGGIWTVGYNIHGDKIYIGDNNKIYLFDEPITGDFTIANLWDVATPDMVFAIDRAGGLFKWSINSATTQMTLNESTLAIVNNVTIGDNLTIDSILTLRHATTITLESDDSVVTITSSCMILTSDDATSTNRTFTLTDGTTAGQLLIIEWIGAVGSKEGEILDAGSESGLNGTMTFDALDDTIMLKWTGTYWRELSRVEH